MWVVVHHQQVLGAPLQARPLVGGHEAGDVVVLQQRQPIDGTLVEEVLPVGRIEDLHRHGPLVQGAAVDGAVAPAADELKAGMGGGQVQTVTAIGSRWKSYK